MRISSTFPHPPNPDILHGLSQKPRIGLETAYYNLGVSIEAKDKKQDAEALYRIALDINPRHPKSWSNIGAMYHKMGIPSEAVSAYQRAIEVQPDLGNHYYNLGVVFMVTISFLLLLSVVVLTGS